MILGYVEMFAIGEQPNQDGIRSLNTLNTEEAESLI